MRILILGGEGMIGHKAYQVLSKYFDAYVTFRNFNQHLKHTNIFDEKKILDKIDANEIESVKKAISRIKPDFVFNCIGIIKQLKEPKNLKTTIYINSIFPHFLAEHCTITGSKLIHISTDGVFDGKKGGYTEKDKVNISDIYGMTKFLGEVSYPHCLTLRTSIIGHELIKKTGLVEWFLSQEEKVRGYTKAIYSGLPTIELAEIISDYILPNDSLSGIYHVSSEPISKYDLLNLIADRYSKKIEIEPYDEPVIDRSLDSSIFCSVTGYNPPSWTELVNKMFLDYNKRRERKNVQS